MRKRKFYPQHWDCVSSGLQHYSQSRRLLSYRWKVFINPLHVHPGGLITTTKLLWLTPRGIPRPFSKTPPSLRIAHLIFLIISRAFVMYLYVVNNIYRLSLPFTDGDNRVVCKNYRLFLSFTDCFMCWIKLQTVSAIYRRSYSSSLKLTDCFCHLQTVIIE